jgi:cell division protein FtsB
VQGQEIVPAQSVHGETVTARLDHLQPQPVIPTHQHVKRRTARYLLMFVTCVLVANAIVGERGVVAILRANREHAELAARIERLRDENAALRETVRQLTEEPRIIEELARQELGLIRPGEKLFIIADVPADVASSPTDAAPIVR